MSERDIVLEHRIRVRKIYYKYENMSHSDKYLNGYDNYGSQHIELEKWDEWKRARLKELAEVERWMDGVIGSHSVVVEDEGGIDWLLVFCLAALYSAFIWSLICSGVIRWA